MKKKKKPPKEKPVEAKPKKKIRGYDYRAWDKFDVVRVMLFTENIMVLLIVLIYMRSLFAKRVKSNNEV